MCVWMGGEGGRMVGMKKVDDSIQEESLVIYTSSIFSSLFV